MEDLESQVTEEVRVRLEGWEPEENPDSPVWPDEMEPAESPVVLGARDSQCRVDLENPEVMACLDNQDFLEHGAILEIKE